MSRNKSEKTPGSENIFLKVIKGIGYITAVITLILGANQLFRLYSENAAKKAAAQEKLNVEKVQRAATDYRSAWSTLKQGLAADPTSKLLQNEQADLAMEWLRNIHMKASTDDSQQWSDIVDSLLPVLYRNATFATGVQKADLFAHIGWANYLKFRDGYFDIEIEKVFKESVACDSLNPYAHVMWGFWMLYPGSTSISHGNMQEANRHFQVALQAKRDREFVRRIQLSALFNVQSQQYEEEAIYAVNDMRKNNEAVSDQMRSRLLFIYTSPYPGELDTISKRIGTNDHLLTFRSLARETDKDKISIPLTIAQLEEMNKNYARAYATYDSLLLANKYYFSGKEIAEDGVKRLKKIIK